MSVNNISKVALFGTLLLGLGAAASPVSAQLVSTAQVWGTVPLKLPVDTDLNNVREIAAGSRHVLLLHPDGSIFAWGKDDFGQVSEAPSGTGWVQVAAGADFSVARDNGGGIRAWGNKLYGQLKTPLRGPFVDVAAGGRHGVALRADGSLVSWGDDTHGEVRNTPTGTGFVAVAAGLYHSVALRRDRTPVTWGDDTYGQVRNTPTDTRLAVISAGGFGSAGLDEAGKIVGWGAIVYGNEVNTPEDATYIDVAVGMQHTVAIRSDGKIVTWGTPYSASLPENPLPQRPRDLREELPAPPPSSVASIYAFRVAAGACLSVALRCGPPPVVNAGPDQTMTIVHDGNPATKTASFTLKGTARPFNSGQLYYKWRGGSSIVSDDKGGANVSGVAGQHNFTLTVTDHYGLSGSDSVRVNIAPEPNKPPVLTVPTSPVWVIAGSPVTFTATATDPDGDPLTFSLVSSSSLGSINSKTGVYSWTPAAPGTYPVPVQVFDPYGSTPPYASLVKKTVTITVSALSVENVALTRGGLNVTVRFNLRKPSTVDATSVQITSATLRGVGTSTPVPMALNTIKAGASVPVTLQFANVAAGQTTLVVSGTSANGPIYASLPVTVP